jgi:hypothetical protein
MTSPTLWATLTQSLFLAALNAFPATAILVPQSTGVPVAINCLELEPAMAEDLKPGETRAVVRLFVNTALIVPAPLKGDVVTYNGANYAVMGAPQDINGGAVLKLRKT